MSDDERAAMRARDDAWQRKFNGCLVYDCDFTGYADFATDEVAAERKRCRDIVSALRMGKLDDVRSVLRMIDSGGPWRDDDGE